MVPISEEMEALFTKDEDALLVIYGEYFIQANKRALELLEVSSMNVITALHPAKISPEFQPDGESSKLKANHLFAQLANDGWIQFDWRHISISGNAFDVRVTLRVREEDGKSYIDVHWHEY